METNYKMADGSQMVLSDLLSSSLTGEMPQMMGEGEGMSTSEGFTFSSSSTLKDGGTPDSFSLRDNPTQHQLLSLPPNDPSLGVPHQLSDVYPGVDALFRKISQERINSNNIKNTCTCTFEVPKNDKRPPPLLKLLDNKSSLQYQPFVAPPIIKSVVAPPTFLTTRPPSSKPSDAKVPHPLNYKEWVELVLPSIPTRPFVPKLLPPPSVAPPLLKLDDPLSKMRANGFKLLTLPPDHPNMQHVHVHKSRSQATPTNRQRKRQIRFKSPDVTMDTVTTTTKATSTRITSSSSDEAPSSLGSSLSNKPRPMSPSNEKNKENSPQTLPSNKPHPQDTRPAKNQLTLSAIKHVNISTSSSTSQEEEEIEQLSGTHSPSHHSPMSPRSGTPSRSPSPPRSGIPPCSPSPCSSSHLSSLSPPLTRRSPSLKTSVAIQVDINDKPHPPRDGPRLYTDVIDIEEEEEEEEVVMVTDQVTGTPPIPRRHYGNRPDDVMKQFEMLEKQLSLLEANAEDIRDEFITSRRILSTIDRLTPTGGQDPLTPSKYGHTFSSPLATPRYHDNGIGSVEKSPPTPNYKKGTDTPRSQLDTFRSTSPYTDITNDGVSVDGDSNDKRSNLRRWMSKKFYERNTEYKNQREELRKKEKRPFKTKSTSSTPKKSLRQKREEEEINRHSRLKEAHTLMEDLLHSNSILSNSLKHQLPTEVDSSNKKKTTTSTNTSVKEKREKENRRGFGTRTSRSVQQSPARTEGGSYGKRRIASVEGLTAREQDKMAEILATFKNERDGVCSSSSVDWDEVDEIMAASS